MAASSETSSSKPYFRISARFFQQKSSGSKTHSYLWVPLQHVVVELVVDLPANRFLGIWVCPKIGTHPKHPKTNLFWKYRFFLYMNRVPFWILLNCPISGQNLPPKHCENGCLCLMKWELVGVIDLAVGHNSWRDGFFIYIEYGNGHIPNSYWVIHPIV